MVTKNEFLIDVLADCTEAFRAIEQARKALAHTQPGGKGGQVRSEAYEALTLAFGAVVEYQRAVINGYVTSSA